MDIRNIDELGFAVFGQLLNQKADFRILQCEGILKDFDNKNLEKIFQLPYGLDIDSGKEYLCFAKVKAYSGKYGPLEHYIFIVGYKYAGIDVNKRKNYYGGCIAYKYNGYVIKGDESLNYLSMALDLAKSIIVENKPLPLKLQSFNGVKMPVSFEGFSYRNNLVIPAPSAAGELKEQFINFNYVNSRELSGAHRFILALGSGRIQGINGYEIKAIEVSFEQIVEENKNIFSENGIKFIETNMPENGTIMIENKNDARIEEALNTKLKSMYDKIDAIEKKLNEMPVNKTNNGAGKYKDIIFMSLIIILLGLLAVIFYEVIGINIITKPAQQQLNSGIERDIEKITVRKIDSLNQAEKLNEVIYVAGKNENISKIAGMFKVVPERIINKNAQVKAGDTLIIKK